MSAEKDRKTKGFNLGNESFTLVQKLISDSGMKDVEWFESVIHKIAANELVLDKENISPELRKHFSSDVSALKEAMNLINTLFLNQMNRIAVEKGNWTEHLNNTIRIHEEKQQRLQQEISLLEGNLQVKDEELEELNRQILSLSSKVEGFTKLEEQLTKGMERLEGDNDRLKAELETAKEHNAAEKSQYIQSLEELKLQHKEEKSRLNQQIVDTLEQLKEMEPISKENSELKDINKRLEEEMVRKSREYEINLTRAAEQAEVDKERALLARERELNQQSREDNRELYEKIEQLQRQVQDLTIENNNLKK
ncbi:hypothetical protein [Robertmurraya sp. FSL R5-0851]|uniref:hypothetical protein n=1 Tax=Robertmurraya sp. FSL R5-0851 TaxID=2921584 RepID=UPI0030F881E8